MDQLRKLLADLTAVQRISIAVVALIAAAAIASLVHYRTESDFRPLYTSMAPEDAAPVAQKLKETGVDYRLTDGGSSILVPSARLAESRLTLASAGLPKSGRIGFELFDKTNFGATELVEHINYQRALEGELERSVMSMGEVTQARVHLTFPRESVFLDQQQPAKASVMVKLRPGAHLSAQNVLALSNLAASAVEGLSPDAVAVIDMDGNLLSRPKRVATSNADAQISSESLEVRQQLEKELVAKINATLDPLLGPDQFRAGASVECDLTSGEQDEETFNPDQSVMVSSQKSEDHNDRGPSNSGIPGTASNLPNPPAKASASLGSTSHQTENVTYQTSRLVRHTRIPQGVVRKMSLSVLVGQPSHWEGVGKARHLVTVPPSPDTLKTIRDLIAGVTGLDANRGDQLIVETLPFETIDKSDPLQPTSGTSGKPDTQPAWMQMFNKYKTIIIGAVVAIVVLGVAAIFFLRKKSPGTAVAKAAAGGDPVTELEALARQQAQHSSTQVSISPETQALLAGMNAETAERVRQLAMREPAVSANVIRMWLHGQRA
jgi:flagellar M-ring protein FliF